MAAEYTALGRLFSLVLDVHPIFPVLMVGTVTSLYTAAGGVYVTIRTHQYHAYFSLTLLLIVLVYIGVTFDTSRLGPIPTPLEENKNRATSIFSFAIPIFTMYIFGDDVWTRVWAAKDKDTLYKGGIMGGLLLTIVVFVFGFCSFLAAWAGYDGPSRMAFFAILDGGEGVPYWILIVVSMFGITVSQSNIDSLQNGIVVCIISLAMSFGMRLSLNWTRVVVLLINIPVIYIGIQGLNILSMILFSNMMVSFCAAPIILSIFPRFNEYLHQISLIFSYGFGLIALLLYGFLQTV